MRELALHVVTATLASKVCTISLEHLIAKKYASEPQASLVSAAVHGDPNSKWRAAKTRLERDDEKD